MKQSTLHKVEVSILYNLRHSVAARFSTLMKPTGLTSDSFKFYLRRLTELGYIQKTTTGVYSLTSKGKEFANTINGATLMVQKQPKLSVLIITAHPDNSSLLLFQKRLRQPYYNFYGLISGPVQWGEDFEDAARRELLKQTGLQASFVVKGFCRQKDYSDTADTLTEDKLFVIITATATTAEFATAWSSGNNRWMTFTEYQQQPDRFATSDHAIQMVQQRLPYDSVKTVYPSSAY